MLTDTPPNIQLRGLRPPNPRGHLRLAPVTSHTPLDYPDLYDRINSMLRDSTPQVPKLTIASTRTSSRTQPHPLCDFLPHLSARMQPPVSQDFAGRKRARGHPGLAAAVPGSGEGAARNRMRF